jgi:hypothetical protein
MKNPAHFICFVENLRTSLRKIYGKINEKTRAGINGYLYIQKILHFNGNGNLQAAFDHSWNENWRVTENRYVLRNANDFNIPRERYKYLDNHPLYNFSRLWNDLHYDLKSIRVRSKFESALKKKSPRGPTFTEFNRIHYQVTTKYYQ